MRGIPQMRILAIAASIAFVVPFLPSDAAHATGVSPSEIYAENVLNNQKLEKKVTVTRGTDEGELTFDVEARGKDSRYLELPSKTVTIHDGERSASYTFYIYPQSAAQGEYEASILFIESFQGNPPESFAQDSGQRVIYVREGAVATVHFTVSDKQIRMYSVEHVVTEDTERGLQPVLRYIMRNTGNVDVRPDRVDVNVQLATDPTHAASVSLAASDFTYVPPGQQMEEIVYLPLDLEEGNYVMGVDFYLDDEKLFSQNGLHFTVYPSGTLSQEVRITDFATDAETAFTGELILLRASVQNVGSVVTNAVVFVQVIRDGKAVDLLRSDDMTLAVNRTGKTTFSYRPQKAGVYTFKSYAAYGITETAPQSVAVHVKGKFSLAFLIAVPAGIGLLFLLILILSVRYWLKKRREGGDMA